MSIGLTAPSRGGEYYYGACLERTQAAYDCSAVNVAVGPTAAIVNASATEGEAVSFTVRLSAPRSTDVALDWKASPGTAAAGVDFPPDATGTLTIEAGETAGTIEIETLADGVAEPDDTFTVALVATTPAAPDGVVLDIDGREATGTIINDDGGLAIPDANLRTALEVALLKAPGEAISASELAALTELDWNYGRQLELGFENGAVKDLTGLEFATNLKALDLRSNWQLTNLAPLSHLSNLASLNLSDNQQIKDVSALASLRKLRSLALTENQISDLDALEYLYVLRTLWLTGNPIEDMSALAGLTQLREIWMDRTGIADLSPLADLVNLHTLWLRSNSISDLRPLAKLHKLLVLKLGNNPISNLDPLEDLDDVRHLGLDRTLVSDLTPIQRMTNMQSIDLSRNSISILDPLKNFSKCGQLYLDYNEISDLTTLAHLRNLTVLSLTYNRVSDITPLAELRSLGWLFLGGNKISDLTPLAGLTTLKRLTLFDNKITDLAPLASLTGLVWMDLSENSIADIAPLGKLPALSVLHLGGNLLTDLSSLASDENFEALNQLHVQKNPLTAETIEVHIPSLTGRGVAVHHIWLSVADVSAKEGELLEATVRLSSRVSEEVEFYWSISGAEGSRGGQDGAFTHIFDVVPTATRNDFGPWTNGFVTIPASMTETTIQILIPEDSVDELHETFVLSLYPPLGKGDLATGVTLERWKPRSINGERSEAAGLIVDVTGPSHDVPLFPPAGHQSREGFARVINRAKRGAVHVEAFDDFGQNYGSATLSLDGGEVAHFNSSDLESGNLDKGLSRGIGPGDGNWRLKLWSNDIDMLTYMRTSDGFLTSMHDTLPQVSKGHYYAPIFNPGSNRNQVSLLRLTNPSADPSQVTITGMDDMGESPGSAVTLTIDAGAARTITAQELESGEGLDGALGDGVGKWRLTVSADRPLVLASLMESPTGHLTNLSTLPDNKAVGDEGATTHHVPLFLSAADPRGRQGFVRVVNRSADDATVSIEAFDDTDWDYDAVTLSVGAGEAAHFNSQDLELGDASKGLARGIGAGEGDWRLELSSEADIDVLAYIRTEDGFLTSMHDTAPLTDDGYAVPIFNPGSNRNQVSHLYIANGGDQDAAVTIQGMDDLGVTSGDAVAMTVTAGRSRSVSAQLLEAGGDTLESGLGDGAGKWRLTVVSDQPVQVLSLLESPTGHLTNLSTATGSN